MGTYFLHGIKITQDPVGRAAQICARAKILSRAKVCRVTTALTCCFQWTVPNAAVIITDDFVSQRRANECNVEFADWPKFAAGFGKGSPPSSDSFACLIEENLAGLEEWGKCGETWRCNKRRLSRLYGSPWSHIARMWWTYCCWRLALEKREKGAVGNGLGQCEWGKEENQWKKKREERFHEEKRRVKMWQCRATAVVRFRGWSWWSLSQASSV